MSTLPKSLRLSIEDSARPDPFSSDDQIDDGSSLDSLEPLDTLAFNSPFAPFASQWGSAMSTSASSGNTQHGGGTVDRVVSQTVASAPVAPAAAGATAAAAHSAIVADGRVASPGGSGLVFNNSFDSSCSAQFEACVVAAEKTLEGLFHQSGRLQRQFQREKRRRQQRFGVEHARPSGFTEPQRGGIRREF